MAFYPTSIIIKFFSNTLWEDYWRESYSSRQVAVVVGFKENAFPKIFTFFIRQTINQGKKKLQERLEMIRTTYLPTYVDCTIVIYHSYLQGYVCFNVEFGCSKIDNKCTTHIALFMGI